MVISVFPITYYFQNFIGAKYHSCPLANGILTNFTTSYCLYTTSCSSQRILSNCGKTVFYSDAIGCDNTFTEFGVHLLSVNLYMLCYHYSTIYNLIIYGGTITGFVGIFITSACLYNIEKKIKTQYINYTPHPDDVDENHTL